LPVFGGSGFAEGNSLGTQLFAQGIGVGVTAIWTAVATIAIAFILSYAIPMRVDDEAEHDGLDLSSHGERGWDIDA
jgi:ammonium transporter, Amt family